MSMFDPMSEQILHYFATDYMWSDDQTGDADAPSGYFGRISVETVEEAASLISEWQAVGYGPGMVIDVKPAELIGNWLAQTDSQGFHYVTGYPDHSTLLDAWDELERAYSAWQDDDDTDEYGDPTYIADVITTYTPED